MGRKFVNETRHQGIVATEPEFSKTANDGIKLKFVIYIKEFRPGQEPVTVFIPITAFGKTAESARKDNLAKGHLVTISGKLEIRNYKDSSGNKRTYAGITAFDIQDWNAWAMEREAYIRGDAGAKPEGSGTPQKSFSQSLSEALDDKPPAANSTEGEAADVPLFHFGQTLQETELGAEF
jgi:single-stranded DNA-binding protein